MKKFFCCFIVLSIFLPKATFLFAQQPATEGRAKIEALLKKISVQKADTNKVQMLTDIAYEYNKVSPYDGIKYANLAIAFAEKLDWKLGIARGNSCLGANYFSLSDFPKAHEYWLKSLEMNVEIGNEFGVANHLHNIGNVFFSQKNYALALEYYEKALKKSQEIGNDKIVTHSYAAIGNVYTQLKDYNKALEYNYKALTIDKKSGVKGNIAADEISIGSVYNEQGNYNLALDMLQNGKQLKSEIGDKRGLANAYNLLGTTYFKMTKDSSLKNSSKANLQLAIAYLDSAITIGRQMGYLDNVQKSYKVLSDAQSMTDNYKDAYYSYKEYAGIKDSVFSLEKQTDIFNLLKKEEIEEKKREAERQMEEKERIEYLQMGGIIMFILILIVSLLFLRGKKVHPRVINILCTFSMLIVFEFINLLIHGKIENLTHHNLLLTLLCLLVIAAIIIPLHHKLEHWLKKKIVH